mmetsp:Transcript_83000/g.262208  ORF Transcript_83000/g.262208 Transcript_83000/m.262208 type:complete len:327 (+) Transcript_83000:81-1061(+)
MAARGRSRLPRVIVETAPDPILEEAVHAEDLQGLTDGGRTPKLGMELMVQDLHQDLCLAPEGHCACAQGSGGRERPAPTSSCLQEEMSESTASARSRTPSPDVSYSAVSGHAPPPPRLVFAPAAARPPAAATHPAEAAAALRGPVPPPPTAAEAPGRAGRPASPETAPPESNGTCQAEDVTDSPVSRRSRKGRHCKIQIATHLRRLDDCNPRCVVMVRKINRLGFDASSILQRCPLPSRPMMLQPVAGERGTLTATGLWRRSSCPARASGQRGRPRPCVCGLPAWVSSSWGAPRLPPLRSRRGQSRPWARPLSACRVSKARPRRQH